LQIQENKKIKESEVLEKAKKIKLLLLDCDGVLTDGRLYFTEDGEALKIFHVRDGQGLVAWHQAGFFSGIISGRNSKIVERRAQELGVTFVFQGIKNKVEVFYEILQKISLQPEETSFIGDDIADIPIMQKVGLSFAVADAVNEVRTIADCISELNGGSGAVREVIDLLLQAKRIRKL
jgi:3-deoxy-D-manno-octulosonate 8-phosphate phosphatase (KDO 8-P phosphatase)